MKLTNVQLMNADNVLGEISSQKVGGSLAFRLFKLKQQLEELIIPATKALDKIGYHNQSDPNFQEVLSIEQEIEPVGTFESHELDDLNMSIAQIARISHFIEEKTEEQHAN